MGLLGADDEPDDEVARLVANAKGDSVTRDLLTELKEGIVTRNLRDGTILDYLADGEQPHFLLHNVSKGIVLERSRGDQNLKPRGGHRAFAVLTDRRVLLLTTTSDGDVEVSVPYDAIEEFTLEEWRMVNHRLTLRGRQVVCRFPINTNDVDEAELDAVRQHLAEEISTAGDAHGDESYEPTDAGTASAMLDATRRAEAAADEMGEEPLASGRGATMPVVDVYPERIVLASPDGSKSIDLEAVTGIEFQEARQDEPGYMYFDQEGYEHPDQEYVATEHTIHEVGTKSDSTNVARFDVAANEQAKEIRRTVADLQSDREGGGPADDGDDGDGVTAENAEDEGGTETQDDGDDEPDEAIQLLREQFATGEISKEEYETRLEVLQDTS